MSFLQQEQTIESDIVLCHRRSENSLIVGGGRDQKAIIEELPLGKSLVVNWKSGNNRIDIACMQFIQ